MGAGVMLFILSPAAPARAQRVFTCRCKKERTSAGPHERSRSAFDMGRLDSNLDSLDVV